MVIFALLGIELAVGGKCQCVWIEFHMKLDTMLFLKDENQEDDNQVAHLLV